MALLWVNADITNEQLVFISTIMVSFITVAGTIFAAWMTTRITKISNRQAEIHDKIKTTNGHTIGDYVEGLAKQQGLSDYEPPGV